MKSIGQVARELIIANPTKKNLELLEMVKQEVVRLDPNAKPKTTVACIAWYKNDLKKNAHKYVEMQETVEDTRTSEVIKQEMKDLQEELDMVTEQEQQAALAKNEQEMKLLLELATKLGIELPAPVQH